MNYQRRFCPECGELTEQKYYPSTNYWDSYFQCRKCGFSYTMRELQEVKQRERELADELLAGGRHA